MKEIINFLFEISSLRRVKRTHNQVITAASDSVADHSFRVAIIGMILAKEEKCDVNKVMKMCLFHDIAESRTGDLNHINKKYVKVDEGSTHNDQMSELPISQEVLNILNEYETRKTAESIVAKDADLIDQMILQQEYFFEDDLNRGKWQSYAKIKLKTKSAKNIAELIEASNPLEWVYKITSS